MATKTKKAKQNGSNKSNRANSVKDNRVRRLDRKNKKIAVKQNSKISGGWSLLVGSVRHLWANKKLFGGIFIIYFILYLMLVNGFAGFRLSETSELLDSTLGEEINTSERAATLFGTLVGSATSVSGEGASVYQSVLYIVFSLVIIWALRQTFEGKKVGIRQSFYNSMHPLIPFVLVYIVVFLQLIPMLFGLALYGIVAANNIAVGTIEQLAWLAFLMVTVLISLYFATSSFMATYIATLSGVTPLKALKLAKGIVKYRRFLIIRRILFFIATLLLFAVLVFLPLVLYLPIVAEVGFMISSLFLIILVHTYFYSLYRELI